MRNLIAAVLLAIALFGLPKNGIPKPAVSNRIELKEPSAAMKSAVSKVAEALKNASAVDRMLWGQVWAKVAKAVKSDSTDTKIVWGDTDKLRSLNETALRIGWRRIGGNQEGKYPGLREATEAAFSSILTTRAQSVTPELRSRYVELCEAVAWAGVGRDQ